MQLGGVCAAFFDTVNHRELMQRLARQIKDVRVLRLISRYLKASIHHLPDARTEATAEGVPQGGQLSPLLANIMLDDLDHELEGRGHRSLCRRFYDRREKQASCRARHA